MARRKNSELFAALANLNRQLGRLGLTPLTTVAEAEPMSDFQLRETIKNSERLLVDAQKAMRGYLG